MVQLMSSASLGRWARCKLQGSGQDYSSGWNGVVVSLVVTLLFWHPGRKSKALSKIPENTRSTAIPAMTPEDNLL